MISNPRRFDGNLAEQCHQDGEVSPDQASVAEQQLLQVYRQRQLDYARRQSPAAKNAETRRVLVFMLGAERYAVELAALVKVFPLSQCTPVPGTSQEIVGIINVGGEICSVVDAAEMLGVSARGDRGDGQVILLRYADLEVGLRVDHVEAIETITADSLARPQRAGDAPSIRFVEGVTPESLNVLNVRQLMLHSVFQSDPVA